MESQLPVPSLRCGAPEFGDQHKPKTELCSHQSLLSQRLNPAMALRRQILVADLFKHIKEIQSIDDGYAFKVVDRSEHVIRCIADYILFESRNSPQLTFAIVEEPRTKSFWLQIRNVGDETHDVESVSVPSDSSGLFLA